MCYSGYSSGQVSLARDNQLYIAVGGKGGDCHYTEVVSGGWNGGGGNSERYATGEGGGGGGATHIALSLNLGELKNYENNKESILIVAGGGGGATTYWDYQNGNRYDSKSSGGVGGGVNGGPGKFSKQWDEGGNWEYETMSVFATQSSGHAFGQGDMCSGGGWYGGIGSPYATWSGGGGSGYIGGVTNGSMQSGVRVGDGFARITLVTVD